MRTEFINDTIRLHINDDKTVTITDKYAHQQITMSNTHFEYLTRAWDRRNTPVPTQSLTDKMTQP